MTYKIVFPAAMMLCVLTIVMADSTPAPAFTRWGGFVASVLLGSCWVGRAKRDERG